MTSSEITTTSFNFDNEYTYPLQWMYESWYARNSYQYWLYRMARAMEGLPEKNLYQEEVEGNLAKVKDEKKKKECKKYCENLPTGRSFTLAKAIANRASQMAAGVDTYEYQINDPYMIIDDDTEDLMAAKCEQDYVLNKMGILSATFSRDLSRAGMAAVLVKYNPIDDSNKVIRINPKNTWWDTKYSSTGEERFRGYSTMISWSKLKKMIEKDGDEINKKLEVPDRSVLEETEKDGRKYWKVKSGEAKYSNHKIRTLNDLDIYVQDMNHLATSANLAGNNLSTLTEYDHDLHSCYNLDWYQTLATDPVQRTNNGYNGDDVELTVMYDLARKIEFKIINRRYVICCNTRAFHRPIAFKITDPITGEVRLRVDDFCLDCPLKFQFEDQENRDTAPYPTSIAFRLLPLHDELCAWRAKRQHVSNILSILRVTANGADADALRGTLNLMGVVIDKLEGDVGTLQFNYDWNAIDSQIAYLETTIKDMLSGYDQFDAMQMMGDRASAAESGMAVSAVAQGLATHQNAIMQLYADIARQCIANRVAYSPNQEFPVTLNGGESAVTIQQMALSAVINVKPKLAKKVNEKTTATNALSLLGNLNGAGLLTEEGVAALASEAMLGAFPRKMIKTFIKQAGPSQAEVEANKIAGQNMATQLAQNQAMYENNPMPYEADNAIANTTPEQMDDVITQIEASNYADSGVGSLGGESDVEVLDMQEQPGAMSVDMENLTSDSGSALANPNSQI